MELYPTFLGTVIAAMRHREPMWGQKYQTDRYLKPIQGHSDRASQCDLLPDLENGNENIEEAKTIDKPQPAGRNSSTSGWDNSAAGCRDGPSG